jgi:hypothetical protein
MKKIIICAFALIISCSSAFSQSSSSGSASSANGADKSFHFGLNIKPGFYWLNAETSNNTPGSGSLGFGFGVNLEFYFTQNYGFCTGLELTSFNANYINTVSGNANQFKDSATAHQYSMQYLEIPLTFKFRTLPIGLIKYFGIVGLEPGIRVSATDNYTITGGDPLSPKTVDKASLSNSTSILRLPYIIGAGIEYNIAGTTCLQGYICYDSSFLNMNSNSNSSVESGGITLTIGVLF